MRKLLAIPLLALALSATGCATTPGSGGGSGSGALTAEMFQKASASDAYVAVQSLRPQWLRTRGVNTINQPEGIAVFLDNTRMGGVEALRSISIFGIASIEFLDAREATFRWGTGYTQGAILVRTTP